MSIGREEYTSAQVLAWLIYQGLVGQPLTAEDVALALECDVKVARRLVAEAEAALAGAVDKTGEASERAALGRRLAIVLRRLVAGERLTRKRVQLLTGTRPDAALRLLDDLSRLTPVTTDQRVRLTQVRPVDGGTPFVVRRPVEVWYLVR